MLDSITPFPWHSDGEEEVWGGDEAEDATWPITVAYARGSYPNQPGKQEANAVFIAAAPQIIADLLARLAETIEGLS